MQHEHRLVASRLLVCFPRVAAVARRKRGLEERLTSSGGQVVVVSTPAGGNVEPQAEDGQETGTGRVRMGRL